MSSFAAYKLTGKKDIEVIITMLLVLKFIVLTDNKFFTPDIV